MEKIDVRELKNNMTLDDIRTILESMGCEHVVSHGNYLTSTKGHGSDNPTGVVVWGTDNYFQAEMYTTPEFDAIRNKDIFSVVQCVMGLSFPDALSYVCDVLGIAGTTKRKGKNKGVLEWLEGMESKNKETDDTQSYYDNSYLDQFYHGLHKMWRDEGITKETADIFDICYDRKSDAIVIPIRDETGQLIGAKKRMIHPKDNKYIYTKNTKKSKMLYGLYENRSYIKASNEVIIFEAEKSVLKAYSWGIKNCVALGGKKISTKQAEIIQALGVDVVLALDEDVTEDDIYKNVDKLSYPFPMKRISVLLDDRLKKKEAPADNKQVMLEYKEHLQEVQVYGRKKKLTHVHP